MKNKFFKQRSFYAVFLSVVLSVVLVAGAAGAVTTISTNITTGGTLTVSSLASFNGNVNIGDAAVTDNDLVYLYGTTTVIGAQAFVFGSSTDTSIAGQAVGSVYYDSTNQVLRLFDGSNWHPVASSTDAAGGLILTDGGIRVQLNDYSVGYLTFGTTTQEIVNSNTADNGNGALLTLQATSTTNTPLRILSASSTAGTANLFAILNSGDMTELFVIDGYGNASTSNSLTVGADSTVALSGILDISGMATTTGATGNFATQGTLTVNGNMTLGDSTAIPDLLTLNAMATSTASLSLGVDSTVNSYLYVGGLATTTGSTGSIATQGTLTVGGDVSGTAIDRIFAGVCTLAPEIDATTNVVTIAASSTEFAHCEGATGVTAGDNVFVTATSSLNGNVIIQAASSTAGAISVQWFNLGMSTGTVTIFNEGVGEGGDSVVTKGVSLQFWAFR